MAHSASVGESALPPLVPGPHRQRIGLISIVACLGGLLDVALDIEAVDGFFEGKPVILPHRLRLRCPVGGDAEATGSEPVSVCLVVGFAPNAASPQRGGGKAGYNFPSGEKRSEGHGEGESNCGDFRRV